MKEMNLGRILIENRHKRGITQEELATHIGVSKGAVSKWETNSSLPDISLLPQLASYFDITIDELIGYEPQMEKEEIKKLYLRLSKDFSVLPFDDVLAECLETAKKYYSCYPLLFQLGTLLINHAAQASNSEQVTQIMEKALEWCHRVRTEADEPNLQKEALLMESFCLLQLQRPAEAIDILEPVEMQAGSPEPLLASAYRMTGNDQEAKKILQAGIYKEIMVLLDLFPSYLNLCLNDTEQFAEACERFYRIADIFQMKTLHPSILFGVYITIAQDWMALGNTEQALDVLILNMVSPESGNVTMFQKNFYGFGFILYAVFDLVFLTAFYKSGYKVGKSFILAAIPMVFLMVAIEATSYIPALVWMDSYQPEHLLIQLPILIVGIVCYGVFVPLAYRISAKRFEKVDL